MTIEQALAWWGVPMDDRDSCVAARNIAPRTDGYYCVRWQGRAWLLHRLIATWSGAVDGDEVTRHRCGHAWCVNPRHLAGGTHLDNMRDQYEHERRKPLRKDGTFQRHTVRTLSLLCPGSGRTPDEINSSDPWNLHNQPRSTP